MAVTWSNLGASWQSPHYEYRGLSTDTKPTDVPVNSTFRELDTGASFYFSDGEWNPARLPQENSSSSSNGGSGNLLVVLSIDENDNTFATSEVTYGDVLASMRSGIPVMFILADGAYSGGASLVMCAEVNLDSTITLYFGSVSSTIDSTSGGQDDPIRIILPIAEEEPT